MALTEELRAEWIRDRRVSRWGDLFLLVVEPETVDADLARLREEPFDGVDCPVSMLDQVPEVGALRVRVNPGDDYSLISGRAGRVRALYVEGRQWRRAPELDLRRFSDVECLAVDWWTKVMLPAALPNVRSLYYRGYQPKDDDGTLPSVLPRLESLQISFGPVSEMPSLPQVPAIQKLYLMSGKLGSIRKVGRLSTLEWLDIQHQTRLSDIGPLSHLPRLGYVNFDDCSRIEDFSPLSACKALRCFRVAGRNKIASLAFIRDLPNLERAEFFGCNVVDGDLTPLIGVADIHVDHKRHYSHSQEQLLELTEQLARGKHVEVESPAPVTAQAGPLQPPTADWLEDLESSGFPEAGVRAMQTRLESFVQDVGTLPARATSRVLGELRDVVIGIGDINKHYDYFLDSEAREELVAFIHDVVADFDLDDGDDLTEPWRTW